jgi:hypothetical protein
MRPPPGYPFEGDLAEKPPAPGELEGEPSRVGLAAFIVTFVAAMSGVGFLLAALLVAEAHRAAALSHAQGETMGASGNGAEEPASTERLVDEPLTLTPPIARNIPVFPARFLEGCGPDDLDAIENALNLAISRGAPLYNSGDAEGCATSYDHAAQELARALPQTCSGPTDALSTGRASASGLSSQMARAWALRDTFDGLLEVVNRSRTGGGLSL